MEDLSKVISSFSVKNELNPKIWVDNGQTLNPKVRKNLLEIANEFIDSFNNQVLIDDIVVTGSIANYNWSEYSDVDLHIVVDYDQFPKQMKDLYVEFFDLKKIVFNLKRSIKLFGFDVEVFVEDFSTPAVSVGVYSILKDEWIRKPNKEKNNVSSSEIEKCAKKWMSLIDTLIKNIDEKEVDSILTMVKKIKEKIKRFRSSGLDKGGEMSLENLVFKTLRRNGYIEKLYSIPKQIVDKKLSLIENPNK